MKLIHFKVISPLNNAMSSGPTTLTETVQSLTLASMTAFLTDEYRNDRKVQQQRMTPKIY